LWFISFLQFDVADNILGVVNNQGTVWMGLFMAPGLPLVNVIKLILIMYIKSWAVLVTNVPHEIVFKASGSNNFYLGLLLMMLFLCSLPVAYVVVGLKPSWHCGPFSDFQLMYHVFTHWLMEVMPQSLLPVLDYITSPGIIIPTLVLLTLTIWYQWTLTSMLRESTEDLKAQLHHERTEERRKLVAGKKEGGKETSASKRWASILPEAASEERSDGKMYAAITKVTKDNSTEREPARTVAEQDRLNETIHAKIQRLERPSMSSIYQPSQSLYSRLSNRESLVNDFEDAGDQDNVFEDEMEKESMNNLEEKDNTDIEDDLYPELSLTDNSDLLARPPKIWISKTASMEHDLD